jgi:hypothetical protein
MTETNKTIIKYFAVFISHGSLYMAMMDWIFDTKIIKNLNQFALKRQIKYMGETEKRNSLDGITV